MGGLSLKHVTVRAGLLYFRRKIDGRDTYVRLPALDDPAFAARYAELLRPDTPLTPDAPGTIGALAREFRRALNRRKLSPVTRTNYLRYVARIESEHGHRLVRQLRPSHVYRIRDGLEDTPGAANNYLAVLRLMLAYACERDLVDRNPAAGVPALPLGEHDPWPQDVLERTLCLATPMTRLAILTGLCSGQRIGDFIKMQHGWHDGRIMTLKQGKTGKAVAVPMHRDWVAALKAMPRRSVTLLYDRAGRPFQSTATLRERVGDAVAKAGRPDLTFHGLRKNAANYLFEVGLTEEEIGALTGMSPDMVRHYTRGAQVVRIAERVRLRVTGGKRGGKTPETGK